MADQEVQFPAQDDEQQMAEPQQEVQGRQNDQNLVVPAVEAAAPQNELEAMRAKLNAMEKMVEAMSQPSVELLVKRILEKASRPLAEFDKYEMIEMVESLKNAASDVKHVKANYYRVVHDTLRSKLDQPNGLVRNLVLPLLGDKDHEKVLSVVSKVQKEEARKGNPVRVPMMARQSSAWRSTEARCFYCQQIGHFRANCLKRKRDLSVVGNGNVQEGLKRK